MTWETVWQNFLETISYFEQHGRAREFLLFSIFIGTGVIGVKLVPKFVESLLRRFLKKLDHGIVDAVVRAIRGPLGLITFLTFAVIAFNQFQNLPESIRKHLGSLHTLISGIIVIVFLLRVVDIFIETLKVKWSREGSGTELDFRWIKLINWVGKGGVILIGALMVLGNLGFNIIPMLTGAGFLGAAFALAAQSTMGNVIGSFEIMADKLFKEGDRVTFGEYDGFITKMGLRSVELTSLTGEKINLPNKDLVDKQIRNYSKDGLVLIAFEVGLAYEHSRADVDKAMKLLEELASKHPKIKKQGAIFKGFGESTLDIAMGCWADYTDGAGHAAIRSEMNLAIKEAFDREGLQFAFPSRTIYLKKENA